MVSLEVMRLIEFKEVASPKDLTYNEVYLIHGGYATYYVKFVGITDNSTIYSEDQEDYFYNSFEELAKKYNCKVETFEDLINLENSLNRYFELTFEDVFNSNFTITVCIQIDEENNEIEFSCSYPDEFRPDIYSAKIYKVLQ